jgi:glycosyltransferase involved in cell wall biosynthesis
MRLLDPLLASMERHVVARADQILAVSTPAAEMAAAAGADQERISLVPNATSVADISALIAGTEPRGKSRPLIGWVGTFGPWHGAEVLAEAVARLETAADLLMIGEGSERQACQELAARLGIAERVEWAGSLSHDEAVKRLARCDLLASPHVPLPGQRFFGSPTKLFEYMAIGRPIVASNLEQLGEILEHNHTAVLVEPGDPVSLRAGLAAVLAMPDRGARLGRAARLEAEHRHDWRHRAQLVLENLRAIPGVPA